MTEERLVLAELLEKAGDGDFLRAVAEAVLQLLCWSSRSLGSSAPSRTLSEWTGSSSVSCHP